VAQNRTETMLTTGMCLFPVLKQEARCDFGMNIIPFFEFEGHGILRYRRRWCRSFS